MSVLSTAVSSMVEETPTEQIAKLPDKPSDFRFHVAYTAYSKAWDDNSSEETRAKLNELLSTLNDDENSYELFYSNLGQFRNDRSDFQGTRRVKTQRKSEWRRSEQRSARNARHRK